MKTTSKIYVSTHHPSEAKSLIDLARSDKYGIEDADLPTLREALRCITHTPIAGTDLQEQVELLLRAAERPGPIKVSDPTWHGNLSWISQGKSWHFVSLPSGNCAWVGLP